MKMNDHAAVSIGAISTGSLALDLALGIGGLPRGRIVEVFGPEFTGKTTLVYQVIAEARRRGPASAPSIDAEHVCEAHRRQHRRPLVWQPDTDGRRAGHHPHRVGERLASRAVTTGRGSTRRWDTPTLRGWKLRS
jgi:recA bacterial DNA recombination protein